MARWPCRSWLIATVENQHYLEKQRESDADALILELEAGTVDKVTARALAVEALEKLRASEKYRAIRINSLRGDDGKADLVAVAPAMPDAIVLSKVCEAEEIREADEILSSVERDRAMPQGSIELAVMVEQAMAIFTAVTFSSASPRLRALLFGGGDYTVDIQTRLTLGTGTPVIPGVEVLMARSMVVAAARATGLSPIDVPHLNVLDEANARMHAYTSRALGFDGMVALSPRQVSTIHEAFAPSRHEIENARQIVDRYDAAVASGRGVISAGGEMISATTVEWYRTILSKAESSMQT